MNVNMKSQGGKKYFINSLMTIQKCWIYFMKKNFEVATIFERFKTLVENQAQTIFKSISFDNGREYTSQDFNNIWKSIGIIY